jgi:hypothetical protein
MRQPALLHTLFVLALGCFALGATPTTRAAQEHSTLWVIAHKGVSVTKLSRDELRLIFQTRRSVWPDGSVVRPFNLMPSEPARQVFDRVVLGLTPDLMPRYWIDRRIRGESHPPQDRSDRRHHAESGQQPHRLGRLSCNTQRRSVGQSHR